MTKDELVENYLSVTNKKFEEGLYLYLDQNKRQLSKKLRVMRWWIDVCYVFGTIEEFEEAAWNYYMLHSDVSDIYVEHTMKYMLKQH